MKKSLFIGSMIVLLTTTFNQSVCAQRRWSPQAKDATIGAIVGGAAGAIINKRNRAVGGVIGGVVGGAAGYAIGKRTDNRRKEAARVAAAREAERRAIAEREAVAARTAATAEANVVKPNAVGAPTAAPTPGLAYSAVASPAPSNLPYLLNASYGDPSSPYGMSKYRRKSW